MRRSKTGQNPVHHLAGLVAAGVQDAVVAERAEVPREFLVFLENKFALLSSTEAEIAGRDIFKVIVVVLRYLPDFQVQPIKDTVFRSARRIAVRDGRLQSPTEKERQAYRAACGARAEAKTAARVAAPVIAPKSDAPTPDLEERLKVVDDERRAKLAALADSMLEFCAARPATRPAVDRRRAPRRDSQVA
ncbi:MAG: hypothetical protein IPK13_04795 [Deltaproteobacteria bacterium]|nr:hypothetical protein [Deltaproteobacteria bacterium]